ncbi:tRNA isopentenyltransferase [Macleaya cordata]|uniref:adenylate dimethylallyltransferase (ADP/ATP-dependent) n=1 Tax=Macleaya cordata TaxID=56857 RepID=A0A200Q4Y1_MACCD|nr:tRNA isopentenyltransferase [Macleaya cordata]
MDSFNTMWNRKEKVVIIMGQTGTGKSRLSIDLATRFSAEVINCDKMQVYEGLDIVTNKVTEEEQCGIPHHLLGVINPNEDFTASDFRRVAMLKIESILARKRLPIIVGGSNSFIEALVDDEELEFRSNYHCCFIWVDVSLPLLHSFVSKRVDQMVKIGLVEEVREMFEPNADYTKGIRRAIGVPEMDHYLRVEATVDEETRVKLLDVAINQIKVNTCNLACRQLQKIYRLRTLPGWNIHRIDATDVFLANGRDMGDAWEKLVAGPSTMIVAEFLYDDDEDQTVGIVVPTNDSILTNVIMGMAVAATQ